MKKPDKRKLKKKAWALLSKVKRYVDCIEADGYVTCYTCGCRKLPEEMQLGHLLDGRSNSILFEEEGLRIQCPGCNIWKSGNKEVFIPKFIDEQGREKYDELCRQKRQTRTISVAEYETLIASYKWRLDNA